MLLSLAFLGPVPGCVTSAAHDQVVQERDSLLVLRRNLEKEVRLLKIANHSLDEHVAGLVDEREGLLENREALQSNLESTRDREEALATSLKSREEELSLTAAALVAQSVRVDELQGTYEGLVGDLEAEVATGQVRISQLQNGLQVGVSQDILFASGSARLSREGERVLETVATRLSNLRYAVAVEGHTDDLPIRGGLAERFPTNWELAGARAASVVRLFVAKGVDGSELTAVSHGATRPIASNDTPEGRARNRRIEIRLRPLGDDEPIAAPTLPKGSPAHSKGS